MTDFKLYMVGVWIDDLSLRERGALFHGRVVMQVTALEVERTSDVGGEAVTSSQPADLYCVVELGDRRIVIGREYLFDAPDGAKPGDAYSPELDAAGGDTSGVACGDGYDVPFGGACPVQGEGEIDGFPCYYRARGKGWSLEVYEVGGSVQTSEAIWSTGRTCYVWPDGGYLSAGKSVQNIESAVAAFRAWRTA